jgi:hypothetical protein
MRDLRAIATWLIGEVRATAGLISEREIWLALCVALLLCTLAYQIPLVYRLDVGGSRATMRQWDDDPFIVPKTFGDPEPADLSKDSTTPPYRWATEDARMLLPGLGGGRWLVSVSAKSGRPDASSILSHWDDGIHTAAIDVDAQSHIYRFVASSDGAGDLQMHFVTPPLKAPGDKRSLGLVVTRVAVESLEGWRLPATGQLGLLALALALAYLSVRRFALAPRPALAFALALAVLTALLLARQRMALTLLAPRLPPILAACYALGLGLEALGKAAFRSELALTFQRPSLRMHAPVVALVVLAAILRLGGMLHPHARFSDDGLNANNLIGLTTGSVYFTEGLTSEAGGGQAPYPPGQYIILAPLQTLIRTVPNDLSALKILLRVGNALWDSLVVGLVWYILWRGGAGGRAALFGAALYVLPPPLLKSLSVGEFANVTGQALALPLLAFLATSARRFHQTPFPAVLGVLLALALLGHLGVAISLFCLLGCLGLVWLIDRQPRRALWLLLLAGLVAGTLVALFYYTAFWDVLLGRITGGPSIADNVSSLSIMQKLSRQLGYLPVYGIHPLALATGVAGVALVGPRRRCPGPHVAFSSLLIAWWGGTLLSLALLLFSNQAVRWYLFIYPALCLGAGPVLARQSVRGRAGRVIAVVLLGYLLWYGLSFWITQIADYNH